MVKHSLATIGSHSALDVADGAHAEKIYGIVVAQRGREKTYLQYYKKRKRAGKEIGCIDEVVLVNKFSEMASDPVISLLKKRNAIFVPNRSFAVYVGYDAIENKFDVPIFGNKYLLRAEERNAPNNQYDLLKKANVPTPQKISSPDKIDRLVLVKVNEAKRTYERAFFTVSSYDEYKTKSESLMRAGKIHKNDLERAVIEEFVIGAHFNFNFFYSGIHDELELLGVDTRRQTNLDGFLRMPADIQSDVLKSQQPSTIEVGHIACTIRESLLESVFEQAERFVATVQKEYKYGIVGPFALQGAMVERDGKEEFTVFDVSFRMPGSPGTRYTPYSHYLFGENISFGRRIAIELKEAEKKKMVAEITT